MMKLIPYAIWNLLVFTEVREKNSWPKNRARVKLYSGFLPLH